MVVKIELFNTYLRSKSLMSSLYQGNSPFASETNLMRGSELVRIAMMLQEATAICKNLNKPLVRELAAAKHVSGFELECTLLVSVA